MPAIGNEHIVRMGYGDVTEEMGFFETNVGPITALSIGGFLTELADYETKTDTILLGLRRRESWIGDRTVITNAWPTDKAAQREAKLLVQYQDDTTEEPFTLTLPTIDFTKLNFVPGGGDAVLFAGAGANTDIVAWVTSFETIARSPRNAANTVTVTGMRFVGVNS